MKKLSLSILAVMLSVCLLFALSVQCAAAEVLGNSGMGAGENDLNNGFIEEILTIRTTEAGSPQTARTKAEMQTARTTGV